MAADENGGSQGLWKAFENIGKFAAGIALVLYLLGMVVVNVHLSRYGYFSLGLQQSSYVGAGFWALVFLMGPWIVGSFVAGQFSAHSTGVAAWVGKWIFRFPLLLLILLVAGSWLVWLYKNVFDKGDYQFPLPYPYPMFAALVPAYWLGYGFSDFIRPFISPGKMAPAKAAPSSKDSSETEKGEVNIFRLLATPGDAAEGFQGRIIILLIFVFTFSRLTFPLLPAYLAGGQAQQVHIIVKAESVDIFSAAGIKVADKSNEAGPVGMLAVTPQSYVLLPNDSKHAIEIQRDLVQAVLYQ